MSAEELDLVRHEWAEGDRLVEAERADLVRYRRLLEQVEVVVDELRKRVGGTYTLAELAAAYRDAEAWARHVVEERAPSPGWPRDLSLVLAAAFHAYQRGASDYAA
jgi:hypothetical protein